jgi:hypothetical protein
MTISFKPDDLTGIHREDANVQRTLLNAMAGVKLSARESREALPRIENHKWYMSERLGRDVGLRVAVIDYFENIYEPPAVRSESGTLTQRLGSLAKELATIYLTHLSLKAHDGVFAASADEFVWPKGKHATSACKAGRAIYCYQ